MRNRLLLAATALAAAAILVAPTASVAQVAQPAMRGPETVAPLAERLIHAVVNISTSQTLKSNDGAPLPKVPKGSPFEELFDDFFSKRGSTFRDRKVSSLGSGFVIDGTLGLIVTNHHVIDGADEIFINFHDGSRLKVEEVVGRDKQTDLALLRVVPKKPLAQVVWGNSGRTQVGDWVMAIGNPFGLGGSVSVGIVSAKQRDIQSGKFDEFIQTDAAINKGNSGGPLFNMAGEVIGVNTAIISPSGGSIGIGFAVPSDTARFITDQLREFKKTRRGFIGVKLRSVTEDVFEEAPATDPAAGATVDTVAAGGPAEKAGIRPGDVITRFDGRTIPNMRTLTRFIAQTPVGREVDVDISRKGQKQTVKLTIGVGPDEPEPAKPAPKRSRDGGDGKSAPDGKRSDLTPGAQPLAGLKLGLLDGETRKRFKLTEKTKGLVVLEVDAQSQAAQRGIKVGDVVVETAQKPVESLQDVADQVADVEDRGRPQILLRLEDATGETRLVAFPLKKRS